MKIVDVQTLRVPAIKVIRFARFKDHRGYFTEHYRLSDFNNNESVAFMRGIRFVQCNESFSKKGTVRGLHFQWNPFMGKLVRTIHGHMIDMVLDIRKGSMTYGRIILFDMPSTPDMDHQEWIWIPPGFAHGNLFAEDTTIEYLCSGQYSQGCEAGISPLAPDLDWSICEPALKRVFDGIAPVTALISEKDKNGLTMEKWRADSRAQNFLYETLK
jgi:dTDP-4-dehydrorhamnose 3,5-epimerase